MFISILIMVLAIIFAVLTGYSMCNTERLKAEKRCSELSRKYKRYEDEQQRKITERDKLINKQTEKLIIKNKYLKEIIRATESNTYDNEAVCIRKMKELAQTAIEI